MKTVLNDRELVAIRDSVDRIGRLSDSVFRVGPMSIGLDGVLSWVPGLGELYSMGAGVFILVQGVRAGVPAATLVLAGGMMFGRTAISAVPLAGPIAADLLTAHKWSARLVSRAIDRKLGISRRPAENDAFSRRSWARRPGPRGFAQPA